jgi:hypothetical protein
MNVCKIKMIPITSENKAKKLNCSISDHKDIKAIIMPMYIKTVPPVKE